MHRLWRGGREELHSLRFAKARQVLWSLRTITAWRTKTEKAEVEGEGREGGDMSLWLTGAWPGDHWEPVAEDETTYTVGSPLLLTALVDKGGSSNHSPISSLSLGSYLFAESRLPT